MYAPCLCACDQDTALTISVNWLPGLLGRIKARALHRLLVLCVQYVALHASNLEAIYRQADQPGPRPTAGHYLGGVDEICLTIRNATLIPEGAAQLHGSLLLLHVYEPGSSLACMVLKLSFMIIRRSACSSHVLLLSLTYWSCNALPHAGDGPGMQDVCIRNAQVNPTRFMLSRQKGCAQHDHMQDTILACTDPASKMLKLKSFPQGQPSSAGRGLCAAGYHAGDDLGMQGACIHNAQMNPTRSFMLSRQRAVRCMTKCMT